EAVRRSSVPREQVWVTSKLPGRDHAFDRALAAMEGSVERSGLENMYLYLMRWPNPAEELYVQAWRALVAADRVGLAGSIGGSNFRPEHLERVSDDTGVMPSVNQVELHPYFPRVEQRSWEVEHGVRTQSWSPLGRASSVLREPV